MHFEVGSSGCAWAQVLGEEEMRTPFADVFNEAEKNAMSFLSSEYSFCVVDRRVYDERGTQYVLGVVTYAEPASSNKPSNLVRFVTLSVAPLRLELDLDIGIGEDRKARHSIYELHSLEKGGEFPRRQHNLYEAMHDVGQLQAEFEILAQVLRSCGSRFFAQDMLLWEDLRRQRLSAAQNQEDASSSLEAEKAFRAKRWEEVIKLLGGREPRLGKVAAAKLSYARKQHRKIT